MLYHNIRIISWRAKQNTKDLGETLVGGDMTIIPASTTKIFGDSFFGYVWRNIKFGKADSYIHVLTTYIPVYVIVLY